MNSMRIGISKYRLLRQIKSVWCGDCSTSECRRKISEVFLRIQNEYLQDELRRKGITDLAGLKGAVPSAQRIGVVREYRGGKRIFLSE